MRGTNTNPVRSVVGEPHIMCRTYGQQDDVRLICPECGLDYWDFETDSEGESFAICPDRHRWNAS